LGWEIFVSVCVLFLFIFFLPNAPENKTRSEQKKMNAAYLLLFTTNTNEGTKRNFQTTEPEKGTKLRTLRENCYLHREKLYFKTINYFDLENYKKLLDFTNKYILILLINVQELVTIALKIKLFISF